MLSFFNDISFSHFFHSFSFFLLLLSLFLKCKRVNSDTLTLKRPTQRAPVHSIPYNGLASGGSDSNPNGTVSNDLEMQQGWQQWPKKRWYIYTQWAEPLRYARLLASAFKMSKALFFFFFLKLTLESTDWMVVLSIVWLAPSFSSFVLCCMSTENDSSR